MRATQAHLHAPRRAALHRDRQPRDADGAGLPAGRLGGAAHPPDPRPASSSSINPVAEPDGRDRAVDWFYRHLKGKTDFDNLPPDLAAVLGQVRLPRQQPRRHPAQAGPDPRHPGRVPALAPDRRARPARVDPAALHLDRHRPLQRAPRPDHSPREWHAIAFHEVSTLTALGLPGVWTWGFGEGWGHFYADSVAINHNAIGRGYETFGNGTAETVERRLDPEREQLRGRAGDRARVVPHLAAAEEVALVAAQQHQLHADGRAGRPAVHGPARARTCCATSGGAARNAVRKGATEKPYAVAIAAEKQDDPRRAGRAWSTCCAPTASRSRSAPRGVQGQGGRVTRRAATSCAWTSRTAATRSTCSRRRSSPPTRRPTSPTTTWPGRCPFSFGVEVEDDRRPGGPRRGRDARSPRAPRYRGTVTGDGPRLPVAGHRAGGAAGGARAPGALPGRGRGEGLPRRRRRLSRAGSWIVPPQAGAARRAGEAAARSSASTFVAARRARRRAARRWTWPRLALLQTWSDTQSAGWVRMVLDDRKVPYTLIMDEDVRRGGLRDALRRHPLPEHRRQPAATSSTASIPATGRSPTRRRRSSRATARRRRRRTSPAASPARGVGNLEQFVRAGGVLVTLGGASTLPLDGGIARDVRRARDQGPLHARAASCGRASAGPITRSPTATRSGRRPSARTGRSTPCAAPTRGASSCSGGPTLPKDDDDEDDGRRGRADEKEKRRSWSAAASRARREIEGKPAILDIPTGKGPHRGLRLRSHPPLPDAVGLPAGLERDPELERPAGAPRRTSSRSLRRLAGADQCAASP